MVVVANVESALRKADKLRAKIRGNNERSSSGARISPFADLAGRGGPGSRFASDPRHVKTIKTSSGRAHHLLADQGKGARLFG